MPSLHQARVQHWQQLYPSASTVTLFSNPADVTYFTGFEFLLPAEREAFVLIDAQGAELWYASFSPLPIDLTVPAKPMRGLTALLDQLKHLITTGQITTLQFDAQNLTVAEHRRLADLTGPDLRAFPRRDIWKLRQQKDPTELAKMRQAGQITAQVLATVSAQLKPGQTEQAVAWEIENHLRLAGATQLAFPTIVAFGEHTALPHHQPTDRPLESEMAVLIDVGGKYQGYCGDMTRSWWFGTAPPARYQLIEKTVQAAYDQAHHWVNTQLTVHTPVVAKEIDAQARTVITTAGFGNEFIHTTGHGIGLEVHEPPSVSWQNAEMLPLNTCLTIEPGIYLTGEFGYRYENTLWLTQPTAIELTQPPT